MRAVRTALALTDLLVLLASGAGQPAAAMRSLQVAPAEPTTWEGVLGATAELRGHAPRAEIRRLLLSREQLQARVVEQLGRDPAPQRLAASAKLFTALGLLDRGADLRGLVLQFRGNLVLGQYDPETKQLYVVTGASNLGPLERVTAAHEYTHALQDQYFDLQRLRPRNAPNADRSLAVAALVEADASYVGERYANLVLSPAEREERRRQVRELYREVDLDRIPLVVREQSYFPYTEGVRFLRQVLGDQAMRGEGEGYGPAVDRLFADPPQSTAQILHPERYLRRQGPVAVPLGEPAAALGEDWRESRRGVLGELDHRLILQQYVESAVAARAAEGWAGNGYALFETDRGEAAVLLRTRWDSAAEAAEWQDAYAQAAQRRYGDRLADEPAPAGQRLWRTPDGALLLSGDGADTVLAMAPTAEQAARLAASPPEPRVGLVPAAGGPTLTFRAAPQAAALAAR
jgi:hypothetical protein